MQPPLLGVPELLVLAKKSISTWALEILRLQNHNGSFLFLYFGGVFVVFFVVVFSLSASVSLYVLVSF